MIRGHKIQMMIKDKFKGQTVDNELNEKTWSVYQMFLIEELGLKDDRTNFEKNKKIKEIFDENPLPYFKEFLEEKLGLNVDEPDLDEIERQDKIFDEKLLLYFNELIKVNIHKINLSLEEINTLKKFLLDYYLSVSDIEKILKDTDFEAKHKNIDKKKKKFLRLGLIEKENKLSDKVYIAKLDKRKKYYKLTPCGIFCVLKEIQLADIGHLFMKPDFENRVFEVYNDDPLFELFVNNDLIDMTALSKIKSYDVRWIFADYLKHICQEINKELEFFSDFQKNGVVTGIEVKWNRNLNKKNKTEWTKFIYRLLENVILVPSVDDMDLKPSDLILDPHISDKICSFSYDSRKHSIEIEETGTKNKKAIKAKYCVNDEEYIKAYDPEKGREYTVKYEEIAVKKRRDCFILNRISREPKDYLNSLIGRFLIPTRRLKTQFGYSILQLYYDNDYNTFNSSVSEDFKRECSEEKTDLRMIASNPKMRRLIAGDFYKEINNRYQTFIKFSE